jgi:hypothetical protein
MKEESRRERRTFVWLSEYLEDENVRRRVDEGFERFRRKERLKRLRLVTGFKPWSPSNRVPEHDG